MKLTKSREEIAKHIYAQTKQASILLSDLLHRCVLEPDGNYELFTKPLCEWEELDKTLKLIYLLQADRLLQACEKKAQEKMELMVKGISEGIEDAFCEMFTPLPEWISREQLAALLTKIQALKDKILKEIGGEK